METKTNEPELAPFYQGQIDVFCAPYAVLNALRLLYGIRPLEGRRLLHEALLEIAQDAALFADVLEQRTDYVFWVDSMLERQVRKGGLLVEKPFGPTARPGPDEVWSLLEAWLAGGLFRGVLFQFVRYLPVAGGLIRHWSCCRTVEGGELVLYDCSREPGSLQRIARARLICHEAERGDEKVLLLPHTIRLLRTRLS